MILGYVVSVLSFAWLETVVLAELGMLIGVLIFYMTKKEKIPFSIKGYTVIVFLGLLFMFFVSKNATSGRLSNTDISSFDFSGVNLFFVEYAIIVFILSICTILKIWNTKNGFIKYSGICLQGAIGIGCLLLELFNVYKIIASDPVLTSLDEVQKTKIWNNFYDANIYIKLVEFSVIIRTILPFLFVSAVIILIILLIANNMWEEKIYILSMVIGASVLYLFGGNEDRDRVLFLGIISLIILIISYLHDIKFDYCQMKIIIFIAVGLCIINIDTLCSVVINANDVAVKREEVVSEVRVQQRIGEWDYKRVVQLPSYDSYSINSLIGGERLNPSPDDIYYYILLRQYGLDKNTIVEFE